MLEDFDELLSLLGKLSEFSWKDTMKKNWSSAMRPKVRNMVNGERRLIAMPPRRFPIIPAEEPDIQLKDWREAEVEGEFWVCLPASAMMASLATSAMDAPRLLRRRKNARVVMEISGRIAIDIHEIACKSAAEKNVIQ